RLSEMPSEMLRERTLIAEAAFLGDFAERACRGAEETARRGDARLHQELLRRQPEDAAELPLHCAQRESAPRGEGFHRQPSAVVAAHAHHSLREHRKSRELPLA